VVWNSFKLGTLCFTGCYVFVLFILVLCCEGWFCKADDRPEERHLTAAAVAVDCGGRSMALLFPFNRYALELTLTAGSVPPSMPWKTFGLWVEWSKTSLRVVFDELLIMGPTFILNFKSVFM